MKIKSISTLIILLCSMSLFAKDKEETEPLSVLIIGGGPAGLATAIEAKNQGCRVTIVEKRDAYSRPQTLFLLDSSLKLFEKWEVDISPIRIVDLGDGTSMGFVSIKQLEEQLEKKALALGVEKIHGEFLGFKSNEAALVKTCNKDEVAFLYDILVAADGTHSKVREALAIERDCLGSAKGAVLKIDVEDTSTEIDVSPAIKIEDGFLRRTKVPKASIIFGQFPLKATKEVLQKAFEAQGWSKEVKALVENKALVGEEIDVFLHQARTFSHVEKSAILVGDAAATASFFQGRGANTALKTAEAAGSFIKEVQEHPKAAFQNFNQTVKEITTEMIEDSAFLFTSSQPCASQGR
jgi:2-polyprenyl-6-methoxyphenol hydroxylase-like FAD-dependent oxidoreductase